VGVVTRLVGDLPSRVVKILVGQLSSVNLSRGVVAGIQRVSSLNFSQKFRIGPPDRVLFTREYS
jgi:hypothetical protein